MPFSRCREYDDDGRAVRGGCLRIGAGCEFVHPSEPAWTRAPRKGALANTSAVGRGRGRGQGQGRGRGKGTGLGKRAPGPEDPFATSSNAIQPRKASENSWGLEGWNNSGGVNDDNADNGGSWGSDVAMNASSSWVTANSDSLSGGNGSKSNQLGAETSPDHPDQPSNKSAVGTTPDMFSKKDETGWGATASGGWASASTGGWGNTGNGWDQNTSGGWATAVTWGQGDVAKGGWGDSSGQEPEGNKLEEKPESSNGTWNSAGDGGGRPTSGGWGEVGNVGWGANSNVTPKVDSAAASIAASTADAVKDLDIEATKIQPLEPSLSRVSVADTQPRKEPQLVSDKDEKPHCASVQASHKPRRLMTDTPTLLHDISSPSSVTDVAKTPSFGFRASPVILTPVIDKHRSKVNSTPTSVTRGPFTGFSPPRVEDQNRIYVPLSKITYRQARSQWRSYVERIIDMLFRRQLLLTAEADYNELKKALSAEIYVRTSEGVVPRLKHAQGRRKDAMMEARNSYIEALTALVAYEDSFDFPIQKLTETRDTVSKLKAEMAEINGYVENQKRYIAAKTDEVVELQTRVSSQSAPQTAAERAIAMSRMTELAEKISKLEKKVADYEHAIEEIRSGAATTTIIQSKLEEIRQNAPEVAEDDDSDDGDVISDTLQRLSSDQDTLAADIRTVGSTVSELRPLLDSLKAKAETKDVELDEARCVLSQERSDLSEVKNHEDTSRALLQESSLNLERLRGELTVVVNASEQHPYYCAQSMEEFVNQLTQALLPTIRNHIKADTEDALSIAQKQLSADFEGQSQKHIGDISDMLTKIYGATNLMHAKLERRGVLHRNQSHTIQLSPSPHNQS